jgi:hypothetical protein
MIRFIYTCLLRLHARVHNVFLLGRMTGRPLSAIRFFYHDGE